jgi:predicted house-cleaning NTP pyrophosphatase (Maf/HAM1 superfamily)
LLSDKTVVEFLPLSDEQIEYYVDKYNPYDKAGLMRSRNGSA